MTINADTFGRVPDKAYAPARRAFTITPHDTNELASVCKGIYVGGDGNLAVLAVGETVSVVFVAVKAGSVIPVQALKVLSTGTTAANLIGLC